MLNNLTLTKLNEVEQPSQVEGVYIGDLLSHVMSHGEENFLWLTVQRHINVIAVAQLVEFSGIIFVENVLPDEDTLQKANELSLPLFSTKLTAYEMAKELMKAGI